ncbi:hypothetical protein [Chryseobacterium indoltheticum]|nr:hypothetical protein [Chryseobacterium indoltheticum]
MARISGGLETFCDDGTRSLQNDLKDLSSTPSVNVHNPPSPDNNTGKL